MGAPKNKKQAGPASDVLDLDAMLAGRLLDPKPVKLGGHVYNVRTDLTPAELLLYQQYAAQGNDIDAWRILVGEDAVELERQLNATPAQHVTAVVGKLLKITGCFGDLAVDSEEEAVGESSAS